MELDIKQLHRMLAEQRDMLEAVRMIVKEGLAKESPNVFYYNRSLKQEEARLGYLQEKLNSAFRDAKVVQEQKHIAQQTAMRSFLIQIKNNILMRFKFRKTTGE